MFGVESSVDPISPWFNVLLQTGAFGLLAYIVVLLFPKHSKELRQERENRDKLFSDELEKLQAKFAERNEAITQAINRQTETLVQQMRENIRTIMEDRKRQ